MTVESPGKGQKYEIKASEVQVVGSAASDYPFGHCYATVTDY